MEFDSKILKYLKLDKLVENLVGYGETKLALIRLEVEEKLEELAKSIETTAKCSRHNVKKEAGMFGTSPSIITSAMLIDITLEITNFRVLFCT